jgi:hypothetical protein
METLDTWKAAVDRILREIMGAGLPEVSMSEDSLKAWHSSGLTPVQTARTIRLIFCVE